MFQKRKNLARKSRNLFALSKAVVLKAVVPKQQDEHHQGTTWK